MAFLSITFFNNIAITAKYLQFKYSVKKIAIIDFDVHHCNGTQEIFYHDPKIVAVTIKKNHTYYEVVDELRSR